MAAIAAQGSAPFVIAPTAFAAYAGSSLPLKLTVTDSMKIRALAVRSPSWESSDPSKAWITPDGVVVLLAPGRVQVRARMGNFTAERELDIRKASVRQLEMRIDKWTVRPGERTRVHAIATDPDGRSIPGANPTLAVAGDGASIDSDGQFAGGVPGSYLIVAELGGVIASQRVDVSSSDVRQQGALFVADFEIREPRFEPYTQTAIQLETSLSDDATRHDLKWGVSDTSIAAVSPSGLLELRQAGKVRVWATAGSNRGEREIKVVANPAADVALRVDARDIRVGQLVRVSFDAWGRGSRRVENARVTYAVASTDAPTNGAHVSDDGTFLARAPGVYTIIAALGGKADRQTIVVRPR